MYQPPHHREDRLDVQHALIRAHPLGALVTLGASGLTASHIPFLLDPDTSKPLPREGVVTGRAAFYDILNRSHWGGVISGDEITIDWSTPCPCGLASVPIAHDIMRYSEKKGVEDDRISCSATQEVQHEALAFMREFEG